MLGLHENAVIVISAQSRSDQLDQIGQDLGVIHQVEKLWSPPTDVCGAAERVICGLSRPRLSLNSARADTLFC